MQDTLLPLMKEMGGRDEFVRLFNAVLDETGDRVTKRMTQRNTYNITTRIIPPAHQIIILAAAALGGVKPDRAVELYPQLAPVMGMIEYVTSANRRKARAA